VNEWRTWGLRHAFMDEPELTGPSPDMSGALVDLSGADLSASVSSADRRRGGPGRHGTTAILIASLKDTRLIGADLTHASLRGAKLTRTDLTHANLSGADLTHANLSDAELFRADLSHSDLSGVNLCGADLRSAALVNTNLTDADLTGCRIFGISAWNLKLEGAKQQNLIITPKYEPTVTVDNIEVAQFIYLMLNNQKVREFVDTITSKAVLILGRFTAERKAVLDALRDELRKRNYLPILFDFNVPATRDITETVSLLARMARFIIADLTDPSSIPKELEAIVPSLAVPVQPLLEGASQPYAMFKDYWKYEWVLPVYRYEGLEPLLATFAEKVIAPAEGKVQALAERRHMFEAELTKPR
jgi:Pentapeptide repeats (8 copies)